MNVVLAVRQAHMRSTLATVCADGRRLTFMLIGDPPELLLAVLRQAQIALRE